MDILFITVDRALFFLFFIFLLEAFFAGSSPLMSSIYIY